MKPEQLERARSIAKMWLTEGSTHAAEDEQLLAEAFLDSECRYAEAVRERTAFGKLMPGGKDLDVLQQSSVHLDRYADRYGTEAQKATLRALAILLRRIAGRQQ